jgi:ABC-type glycerol-3-phosphate transport system substrate-binding protein
MPANLKLPVLIDPSKGIDKGMAEFRTKKTPSGQDIKNQYVNPVVGDVVRGDQVYGLPLSVDSMVLYYNRALLDQAKITQPPRTWTEVKDAVKAMTIQNSDGTILQSGINLGGIDNNNRAADILSLLMLQTGTQMINAEGRAAFNERVLVDGQQFSPGADALRFYTDFARPTKEVYTWNENLTEAQELFTAGRLGLFLGYAYQLPYLRAQGPKVDIGVAPVPHLNADATDAGRKQVNFANYWVASVAKQAKNTEAAWDVVLFATSEGEAMKYLNRVKRPPSLRSLIAPMRADPDLAVFIDQLFTAQSWYRGRNPGAMESSFRAMIEAVVDGTRTAEEATNFGVEQINQIL